MCNADCPILPFNHPFLVQPTDIVCQQMTITATTSKATPQNFLAQLAVVGWINLVFLSQPDAHSSMQNFVRRKYTHFLNGKRSHHRPLPCMLQNVVDMWNVTGNSNLRFCGTVIALLLLWLFYCALLASVTTCMPDHLHHVTMTWISLTGVGGGVERHAQRR